MEKPNFNCLSVELNKAFCNKWFVVALMVGIVLAAISACSQIERYLQYVSLNFNEAKYYPPHLYNCFGMWMSVEFVNPTSLLFYRLAPLLATVPFSWSIGEELRCGYSAQIRARVSSSSCIASKLAASFVVGGVVIVVPQLLNIAMIACFVPAYTPEITDAMYLGIFHDNLFSGLFYARPVLYVAAYCILDFLLCGLWAAAVSCFSFFARNRVLTLSVPYVMLVVVQVVNERIFLMLGGIKGMQLSLFENLRAATSMYVQSWDVIIAEFALLMLYVVVCALVMRKSDLI